MSSPLSSSNQRPPAFKSQAAFRKVRGYRGGRGQQGQEVGMFSMQHQVVQHSGPWPLPAIAREYEVIAPGATKELIDLINTETRRNLDAMDAENLHRQKYAEKEQAHRHAMDIAGRRTDDLKYRGAISMGILSVAGAILIALMHGPTEVAVLLAAAPAISSLLRKRNEQAASTSANKNVAVVAKEEASD